MTLKEFYQLQKSRLANDTAALDARLLLCHVLQFSHEQFVLYGDRELTPEQKAQAEALIARRLQGMPVAKIIGEKEFYGRVFKTTADTLDPRPDSETLIEAVLEDRDRNAAVTILDLGTGTGCLALTLLAELRHAQAIAVDRSEAALKVARENAWKIGVEDRVVFVQSDWFSDVMGQFDIIISNPPYIPDGDIPGLAPDVRDYDPMAALAGGADGLDPYRRIIPQLGQFLKKGGFVAFELGQGQAPQVAEMLKQAGFSGVSAHCDLAGIERVVIGRHAE